MTFPRTHFVLYEAEPIRTKTADTIERPRGRFHAPTKTAYDIEIYHWYRASARPLSCTHKMTRSVFTTDQKTIQVKTNRKHHMVHHTFFQSNVQKSKQYDCKYIYIYIEQIPKNNNKTSKNHLKIDRNK